MICKRFVKELPCTSQSPGTFKLQDYLKNIFLYKNENNKFLVQKDTWRVHGGRGYKKMMYCSFLQRKSYRGKYIRHLNRM